MDYYHRTPLRQQSSFFNGFDKYELERQFQEQQEELQRELQQRSTQQLLEQFYYDNYDSKDVDLNLCRQSASKLTSTYDKQPHHITNLNNLNYLSSTHHTNYNTINQSSARDILYELKQYERFASNDNRQLNQQNFNSDVTGRHPSSTFNGTNYSQNIINYNNSFYKINNINNYNCIKNQSSSSQRLQEDYNKFCYSNNDYASSSTSNKMEKEEVFAENSKLMNSSTEAAANGRQATIHNFNHSNIDIKSHTTIIPQPYDIIDDVENRDSNLPQQRHHNNHLHEQENQHNRHPIYRSQHFSQIIASLAVSIGPLAAGLGKGYSSPAIDSLQELHLRYENTNFTTFSVSEQEGSWIASLSLLGALFGGMFGGLAMQYGRKRVLALMSLPFSLSWFLTVFAKSVDTMFMTAFIAGFCCSIVSMVTQVYVSEISSPDIRGFLSAIQKISGHLGFLLSYLLGAYLDWRQLALLIAIAPVLLFVTVIFIPETPSFLVLKGRDEDAYRSLQWLRGSNKNVEIELETIRNNIRASKFNISMTSSCNVNDNPSTIENQNTILPIKQSFKSFVGNVKSVLRNTRLVKPILITCGLMIFQRFTGANSFSFYAVQIFRQSFSSMNPHTGAISVGFVQLLASLLSGLLIDTIGRIPLLITSSVFMSLALASFGSYYHYEQHNGPSVNNDWIPLLCVLIFTIAFSLGISPISWLLVGELFPLEYRGIGSSIATSFSYFCAFLAVKTFVDFKQLFGLDGAFWLFACISCIGLCFVIIAVPETKGKDLDEMDPKHMKTIVISR